MILFSTRFWVGGVRVHLRPVDLVLLLVFAFGWVSHGDSNLDRPNLTAVIAVAGFSLMVVIHLAVRLAAFRLQHTRVTAVGLGFYGSAIETNGVGSFPRHELSAAVAGVLTAVTGAGIVWVLHGAVTGFELLAPVVAGFALLQLLPALPLDAARALWSFVWPVVDNDVVAARLVHRYGWVIVAGLAMFGAVLFDRSERGPYWGLAAIVVAIELAAASSEMVSERAWRRAASAVRLADAGAATVTTIEADRSIASAIELLLALDHAGLLVVAAGEPVGALFQSCLRRAPRATWDDRAVSTIMLPLDNVPRLDPELDLSQAIDELDRYDSVHAQTTLGGRPALVTRHALRTAGSRSSR